MGTEGERVVSTRRDVMAAGLAAGLGGLAASAATAPPAFAAVSGQYNVKDDFGAAGDGSTDDRVAIQDAIDAADGDGGGIVFFPAGVYAVDASTSLTVPDGVQLAGVGPGSVIRCDNEGTTASIVLLDVDDGARVLLSDLTFEGPATLGGGGSAQGALMGGAGGSLRAERCAFAKFTYSLRVSSNTIWVGAVEAIGCTFVGYGDAKGSTPILLNSNGTGGRGRRLTVVNSVFRDYGKTSSNLDHAIYAASDWDIECAGCEFASTVGTGYSVHVYDANVSVANASRHQKVVGCRFAGDVRAVLSASKAHLLVDGCTFESAAAWVTFNGGGGDVVDCDFVGTIAGNNGIVVANQPATPVTVKNSRFLGSATKLIYLDAAGTFNFEGNTFSPSSNPSYCISVESAATVRVADNSFLGANNSACVRVSGSGASKVTVESNRFRGTGGDGIETSNSNSVVEAFGNDFSQSSGNSMNFYAMPSTLRATANQGSRSPSSGKSIVATEESRSSSAYGLLSTPDRVQGIVVPNGGILAVTYRAQWKATVSNAARAAIFVGANALQASYGDEADVEDQNAKVGSSVNTYDCLMTLPVGLVNMNTGTAKNVDPTTPVALGGITSTGPADYFMLEAAGDQLLVSDEVQSVHGGACLIKVAPGAYDISVQFKAASGTVTVRDRYLWVEILGF